MQVTPEMQAIGAAILSAVSSFDAALIRIHHRIDGRAEDAKTEIQAMGIDARKQIHAAVVFARRSLGQRARWAKRG